MKKVVLSLILVISFFINSNAQVPSNVPTNGLVGYWPFNGNANDASGNGNNGTVNGATLTADRNGITNNSYMFDGISKYIEVPSTTSISVTSSYTISVWFNASIWNFNAPIDEHAIVSKIVDGAWYGGYEIYIGGVAGWIKHIGNIGSNFSIGPSGGNINTWYNVVTTFDGSKVRFYLNGIKRDSIALSGSIQTSATPLRFGRRGGAGSNNCWFNGKIDDIGIWNRALSQSEITALYNTPTASSSDTLWVINKQADTLSFPDQVKLSIKSSNITSKNISAYDIKLNYDASRLKFDSVTKTNTVSAAGSLIINSTTPGQVIIGWASSTSTTSTNLPLLNCYFTPIDSGKTTVSISSAILNTDTVKNKYSKSVITKYNFGDVDMNKIIQSYDASLVLKYSVGIDPLPAIDPLPWEAWRVKVASVDTSTAVNANDVSLILKYSVGLITKFPKRGPTASAGYVTLSLENNEIVVRSYEDIGGLNISFLDHLSDLSSPSYIYANNTLSAFNKQLDLYKVGLAFSEAPTNGTIVLRIPYTGSSNQTLNMEIVENTASRNYELTISTGLNDFKTTKLNIHPNPTTQSIHIDGLSTEMNNSAMIYSIQGQVLKSIPTIENAEIDLSDFNPGVYLIKINDVAHRVVKL